VHANELRPAALTAAIGRGDFYASTGIRLDDIVTRERRAPIPAAAREDPISKPT